MKCISVIVPCYNVENYIDRCLESFEKQTIGFDNIQLILVNDASTDGTLQKLQEWEEKYPENILIVTYDENLKQGGAKNVGLDYAEADYVGFVDADDWIEPDMYELLYEKALETKCDVIKCKLARDNGRGNFDKGTKPREDAQYSFEYVNGVYLQTLPKTGNNGTLGGAVCGIYKRCILINNNIRFPEGISYEDNFWGQIIKLYTKDMYIIDKVLYHYYMNEESTILKRNSIHHLDRLKIEIAIVDEYIKRGLFESFRNWLLIGFIKRFYINTLHTVYLRFDYLAVDINDLRKIVSAYFPDFKEILAIDAFMPHERLLMDALFRTENISLDEQEQLKKMYIKTAVELARAEV